jgi:dihydroflavonol-4-reductase
MTPQTILVTGAAGFVGAAVARALVADGHRVRALVRASSPRENLLGLDAAIVTADLLDAAAVAAACVGADAVMHVAADYRLWARDPEDIVRNNVEQTTNVMRGALAAGVARVVYTSSVATLGFTRSPADETDPLTPDRATGAYKRSKVVAERLVEAMVRDEGLPAVIVMPSTPIGPRDVRPTPTGRIIVEAATGKIPAFVDTGLNLVHVDDVARGHLLALYRGVVGERYILGGQDVSLRTMLAEIAALTGRRAPTIALPRRALFPLAWGAEAVAWMTGREPFVTADALRMAGHHMYFTSAKAEAQLGYSARPYREALADALAWFGAAGML